LYVQARSALVYDEGSRRFVIKFKHGDGTYLAPPLATMMMRVGQEILANTDILIPVPLHWRRLFWRQYNQATLLSLGLTHQTGILTKTDILKRFRSTPSQGHQNRKERYHNIRGAFRVTSDKAAFIKGKRLTIIDDVLTTGSTVTECARTLLRAGAKEVRVITLARVMMSS
jgi:ComF family protein